MKSLMWSLVLVAAVTTRAQQPQALEVVPLFTNVNPGPAFMLTCVNDTEAAVDTILISARVGVRLDGEVVPWSGEAGGGVSNSKIPRNGSFKMIYSLTPEAPNFPQVNQLGALVRVGMHKTLSSGPHTVQFQCFGRTSSEMRIYVENVSR